MRIRRLILPLLFLFPIGIAFAQRPATFPLPDQSVQIQADLYGSGKRAVILAHGGRFHKESWKKQAEVLAKAGFLVLALGVPRRRTQSRRLARLFRLCE